MSLVTWMDGGVPRDAGGSSDLSPPNGLVGRPKGPLGRQGMDGAGRAPHPRPAARCFPQAVHQPSPPEERNKGRRRGPLGFLDSMLAQGPDPLPR